MNVFREQLELHGAGVDESQRESANRPSWKARRCGCPGARAQCDSKTATPSGNPFVGSRTPNRSPSPERCCWKKAVA